MYSYAGISRDMMDSSLIQSNFHLGNDSKYVMFCRKMISVPVCYEGRRRTFVPQWVNNFNLFSVWNEHILIEHGSRMIWTKSLMFLANEVTVPHISFDSINNITHGINL
jgi:hypothetical protein